MLRLIRANQLSLFSLLLAGGFFIAGCGAGNEATPTAAAVTEAAVTEPASEGLAEGQLLLVLAPEGNEARYRVTEQLVRLDLPSDAVGATSDVTGQLVINADGSVVSEASRFSVDLTTLTSDSSRRDGFIKSNTLNTGTYPTADFVPTEVVGLPSPLPTAGPVSFQLVGDLTVRDTTRPVTWDFTGEVQDNALIGTATTSFTFADFNLTQPRVPVVLSVDENIRLELDLHLIAQP